MELLPSVKLLLEQIVFFTFLLLHSENPHLKERMYLIKFNFTSCKVFLFHPYSALIVFFLFVLSVNFRV